MFDSKDEDKDTWGNNVTDIEFSRILQKNPVYYYFYDDSRHHGPENISEKCAKNVNSVKFDFH